ncbi:hypothetical protein BX600DRAFT_519173 [Xylariales sp. PMI_506]|nr:hypothetical protein BX600DRAFT_519173 [Xylariales sp. PMI_506]
MAPIDILIVGCGIAGPTFASFLLLSPLPATDKPRITIVERSPDLRAQGQNIDIRGAGLPVVRKLGLEKVIRAATTGEEGVQFVNSKGRVWASHKAGKSNQKWSPTSDVEILRGSLAEICYRRSKLLSDELEQHHGTVGIEYIFGEYLDELEQDDSKVHVRFAKSGAKRSFDLVVGADGMQSTTRKMTWGAQSEQARLKNLGMYAAFFSIPRNKMDTMWRQWYHAPGRRGLMLRPDKQNGRTTVLLTVINEKDERLAEAATKGHGNLQEQKTLVKEYFQDAGWQSDRIIRDMLIANDFYYEVVGQIRMEKWSRGRVVLLGDAAYCASPLSGMGATLGLLGAYHLAGALTDHSIDLGAALTQYEEKMRPEVERAHRVFFGLIRLMNPESAWGLLIFELVMSFLNWTRLSNLLFMLKKEPENHENLHDYGFMHLPELNK